MRSFLLLSIAILGFWACTKESKPTVTITSPTNGSTMMSGDSLLTIKGTVADEDQLHEYTISLKNTTANTEVFTHSGHSHTTSINIDTTIVLKVSEHSEFELSIMASNHGGANTTEKVVFDKQP
ncbi:MAG: hypothetical protein GY810_16430 [Aureispira sp.]|nr:hypothetical protein [Aureispira sp.]